MNYGALAQLVEHLTFNQVVARSNRARPTIHKTIGLVPIFLWIVGCCRRERTRSTNLYGTNLDDRRSAPEGRISG